MNQGRIWCVVNPTVGLPLFLGSVAVTALIVHYSVLSNTTWFKGYWEGAKKAKTAAVQTVPSTEGVAKADSAFTVSVAPSTGAEGSTQFVVSVTPNGAKQADASPPQKLASATPVGK